MNDISLQREHYRRTARQYDAYHVHLGDEHYQSLKCIEGLLGNLPVKTVLDVGCGTGRGIELYGKLFR